MKIILPGNPSSTNQIYRHFRNRVYMTHEGKDVKNDYIVEIKNQWGFKPPMEDAVEITISLYFKDKRKRDWDNYNKLVCDAMEGIVFMDDNQIQKATVIKGYDKENPRVEITIEKYE